MKSANSSHHFFAPRLPGNTLHRATSPDSLVDPVRYRTGSVCAVVADAVRVIGALDFTSLKYEATGLCFTPSRGVPEYERSPSEFGDKESASIMGLSLAISGRGADVGREALMRLGDYVTQTASLYSATRKRFA